MAIIVQKRPYEYCFCGNPIAYELYSDVAAVDAAVFFEIKLYFKNVGGNYTATDAIPYYPVNGVANINVQDLLEGLLEYEVPQIVADERTVQPAVKHTGKFYLQFREVSLDDPDPDWDDSESDFERLVIKGGISRFKYQGNNFFVNYFFPNKPFLTWQQRGRMAAITERMYLTYLHTADIDNVTAICSVYYTDGSYATVQQNFAAVAIGTCYYVPAGALQWGLPQLDADKKIYYWEITIIGDILTSATALSEAFRYYADNRNDYNNCTLHYRNSLGSLDSIRVRGAIEQSQEYSFTEQAQTISSDYFTGHYFPAQKFLTNSREIISWKGDIGHLGKEEQDRLRDSHLQRECWQEIEGKWWPINITTKNRKQRNSGDTRFTFPIEWTLAHDGDSYYTPVSASLGTAVFDSNVCMAFITGVNVSLQDTPDGKVRATVQLSENDPQDASTLFRYRVLGSFGQLGWFTANYGSFDIIVAKEELMSLELQPICTNNVYGRKTTIPIDTRADQSGGGTGGGGLGNCRIVNNKSTGTNYSVYVDGVTVATGYVAAGSQATFITEPGSGKQVEVHVPDIITSSIILYVTDMPAQIPDYMDGHTAVFYNVSFTLDFQIIIG